jgi:hypothetical protein
MYGFVVVWVKDNPSDTSNDAGFTKRITEFSYARLNGPCIWCIKSYMKCSAIRQTLRNYIGENDALYIFRFDGHASFSTNEINEWISSCELS